MNWLDLGIAVLIIIFVIIGIKNGFMTSLLSNFSLKINAILSFFLCKPISFLLNKLFNIQNLIMNSYYDKLINAHENFSTNLLEIPQNELSSFVSYTLNQSGLSSFANRFTNFFLNRPSLFNTLHSSEHTSRTLSEIVSLAYSNFFMTLISFILSLVLIYLTVLLFRLIVKKLRTIGFVKVVDNTLGAVYGLFRCFLTLVVVCIVIKLLSSFSFMNGVISYISSSFSGRLIYNQISSFIDNYLNFTDIFNMIFH